MVRETIKDEAMYSENRDILNNRGCSLVYIFAYIIEEARFQALYIFLLFLSNIPYTLDKTFPVDL
jgi:hypothetical protein